MNNVSISIDIYAKKAFAMFSPSDGDLASATVFPMDIPAPFTAPGYINYTGVFTKVFNEMLLVNDISEANIRLAAPTEAIAIDYISVPNIGGRKNDENLFTEAKKLFPSITKPAQINLNVIKTTKNQVISVYSLCNPDDLKSINRHLINTNHNLSFYTDNAIATASLFAQFTGNGGFQISSGVLGKDNAFMGIDISNHKTECFIYSGSSVLAQYCIPFGTELFSAFSPRDFLNPRMHAELESHIFKWQFPLFSFISRCKELNLPTPKKAYVRVKDYDGIVNLLSRDSDMDFVILQLPKEYELYENNLALLALFLNKVDKQYNYIRS